MSRHHPNRPTVPRALATVRRWARYSPNEYPVCGGGGALHIFLEDGNIEDDHVQWCAERAEQEGDRFGAFLARLCLLMSKSQRWRLVHKWRAVAEGRR